MFYRSLWTLKSVYLGGIGFWDKGLATGGAFATYPYQQIPIGPYNPLRTCYTHVSSPDLPSLIAAMECISGSEPDNPDDPDNPDNPDEPVDPDDPDYHHATETEVCETVKSSFLAPDAQAALSAFEGLMQQIALLLPPHPSRQQQEAADTLWHQLCPNEVSLSLDPVFAWLDSEIFSYQKRNSRSFYRFHLQTSGFLWEKSLWFWGPGEKVAERREKSLKGGMALAGKVFTLGLWGGFADYQHKDPSDGTQDPLCGQQCVQGRIAFGGLGAEWRWKGWHLGGRGLKGLGYQDWHRHVCLSSWTKASAEKNTLFSHNTLDMWAAQIRLKHTWQVGKGKKGRGRLSPYIYGTWGGIHHPAIQEGSDGDSNPLYALGYKPWHQKAWRCEGGVQTFWYGQKRKLGWQLWTVGKVAKVYPLGLQRQAFFIASPQQQVFFVQGIQSPYGIVGGKLGVSLGSQGKKIKTFESARKVMWQSPPVVWKLWMHYGLDIHLFSETQGVIAPAHAKTHSAALGCSLSW